MSIASRNASNILKKVRVELNGSGMKEESNFQQSAGNVLDDDICVHIFTASAALVGVCLTVIGLFRVVAKLKDINSLADAVFLVALSLMAVVCGLIAYEIV